jgi:hypothetical protein
VVLQETHSELKEKRSLKITEKIPLTLYFQIRIKLWFKCITTYLPHPKLSHNENWSFGDLVLAIAYQYFLVLVQNTTLNGDKNQKKPIVTPGVRNVGYNRWVKILDWLDEIAN